MKRIIGLAIALFAVAMVTGLSGAAAVASNSGTVLDSFESEGTPELSGELTTDGESLFLAVRADPMAVSGNNAYMAWLVYTGDAEPAGFAGPWDDAYLLKDNWFTAGPQGNVQWGVGVGSTFPWSGGPLPSGVELHYAVDGDVGIWTMTIPYDAIAVELGDTISYMVQARYQGPGYLSMNQSHGDAGFNALYFSENYQTVVLEIAPQDPEDKDACKNGGWEGFEFRNQGLCIQFVNTGKDSR